MLICNAAGGLAGRLARGLALAAAAVLYALFKVACLDSLNSLHRYHTPFGIVIIILSQSAEFVNYNLATAMPVGILFPLDTTSTPFCRISCTEAVSSRDMRSPGTASGIPGG